MNLQKFGGIAALVEALAYIIGFVVLFTLLSPENMQQSTSIGELEFNVKHHLALQFWNLVIYVVFGIFLVILVNALHERLKNSPLPLMSSATAFGYIRAGLVIASGMVANVGLGAIADIYGKDPQQALSVWLAITAVQEGWGGGIEVVGGLWVLLVSWSAIKRNEFPKLLNYIGLLVGSTGIITAIPNLNELGAVFGLGQIVWFVWLGITMLQSRHPADRLDERALTSTA